MNLKTAAISFVILSLSSSFVSPAKAQEIKSVDFREDEIKAGILPDSFWYWADDFGEQLIFVFTVGRERKFQLLLNLAEERLAEMKELSAEKNSKYSEELMLKYEEKINAAKRFSVGEKNIEAEKLIAPELTTKNESADSNSAFASFMQWLKNLFSKKENSGQTDVEYFNGNEILQRERTDLAE
ncbi:hypothetical protein KKC32_03345 [Patescibacteria group bacterium]|nr:hypothetical protein [Patescibacteria group bacterium]